MEDATGCGGGLAILGAEGLGSLQRHCGCAYMALFWHDRASKELACVTGIESSFYSFRPITALVKNLLKLQHVALGKSFPDTHKCWLEIVGEWSLLLALL